MNLNKLSAVTEDLISHTRVGRLKQNEIEGGTFAVTNFTLLVDHRAIDGTLAARWLTAFVKRFENPM